LKAELVELIQLGIEEHVGEGVGQLGIRLVNIVFLLNGVNLFQVVELLISFLIINLFN